MLSFRPLHVLVAGGGLGGLALAHGLIKDGHTVEVFERDADLNRKQGYYLNINAFGGRALHRVLPPDLYDLYRETSRASYTRRQSIVLDTQLNELGARDSMGPANDGERNHTGDHRRPLRQILAARLDSVLRLGVAVTGYEQDANGVTAVLSDGTTVRGDVLVGADGIRSAVRQDLLPATRIVDTGIRGISLYGRTPMTAEIDALRPPILREGVMIAADGRGNRLLIGPFTPRRRADEAAREIAPDVHLDRVEDYFMVSCSVPAGVVVPPAREWTAQTPALLRDAQLEVVDGWHPAARAIVAGQDLDTMFMIPFGFLDPVPDWTPSRVTVLGDAAHAMLPTLGMGANLALRDAQVLVDELQRHALGEVSVSGAIGQYEKEMREYAYPVLRAAADHDNTFGGGALARMEQAAS